MAFLDDLNSFFSMGGQTAQMPGTDVGFNLFGAPTDLPMGLGGPSGLNFGTDTTLNAPELGSFSTMLGGLSGLLGGGAGGGQAPAQTQQAPGGLLTSQNIALGGAGLLGGLGLVGALQRMLQGGQTITQKTSTGQPTAQEIAATNLAMQNAQQQASLLNSLSKMIMTGQLGLSPEIDQLVEASFRNQISDVITAAMEDVQQRGFTGEATLSPLYQRMLAQQPGQIAQAKLGLATQIPQLGTQVAAGYTAPGSLLAQLAGQGAAQRGSTTTQKGPSPTLLDVLGPLASTAGGIGSTLAGLAMFNKFGGMSGV